MNILLPIDGSELALHEVRYALRLVAEGLQARFLLVNVQEPATLYEMVTAPDPVMLENVSHAAGEHALQAAEELLLAAGIAFERVVVTGDPAHAVLELIEEYACDMVIIGSQGMGLLRSALQGSVAQTLIHDSPVPVLLVKQPEPSDADVEPDGNGDGDAEA